MVVQKKRAHGFFKNEKNWNCGELTTESPFIMPNESVEWNTGPCYKCN
jgi:hypothetical protein